jgi:serine/alanine adding enzyme
MTITSYEQPDGGAEWNAFVDSQALGSNYHRYGWRRVIERSFGHRSHYLLARDRDHAISGVLPLVHLNSRLFGSFLVSLPFFNYGGVLSKDEPTADRLLHASGRLLRETGARWAELRQAGVHSAQLATKKHKVSMLLDLAKDEQTQWLALDPKVRNQIRKAQKSGLHQETGFLELLDGFYQVFRRNMRDLGTPVYDQDFFRNVLEEFPDSTRIITVFRDHRPIASGLLTWYRNVLEMPWASSVKECREYCPNNLLYWEALRFAIANGATAFDFGRSTVDGGTYRFKKQWGAKPVQLYWQYQLQTGTELPELNPANPKYQLAVRLWQHLPLTVTNLLGPMIVRSIP